MEELGEHGLTLDGSAPWHELAVTELDYALRPAVHERRIPSYGAFVAPSSDADVWAARAQLEVARRSTGATPVVDARKYSDGIVSWLIRDIDGTDTWAVFDRPAGSERDLVVLAEASGAVVVQRHPSGSVRLVGSFGVYRWDGLDWHHEPLVASWIDAVSACGKHGDIDVLLTLLEFAVHDLGARGIGATLVYRPDDTLSGSYDNRLPAPPPLQITRPFDLAPLRHALAQIDGASLFDEQGGLRRIGVRLVPSPAAEVAIAGIGGTRHTSGRRYSFDDPDATVIVVSEDGPVTVMRGGEVLGASRTEVADDR